MGKINALAMLLGVPLGVLPDDEPVIEIRGIRYRERYMRTGNSISHRGACSLAEKCRTHNT